MESVFTHIKEESLKMLENEQLSIAHELDKKYRGSVKNNLHLRKHKPKTEHIVQAWKAPDLEHRRAKAVKLGGGQAKPSSVKQALARHAQTAYRDSRSIFYYFPIV